MQFARHHQLALAGAVAALLCGAAATSAFAQMSMGAADPMVGGAAMFPSKNIVQNAMDSRDHTTLVAAVKAAGLVNTLEGPGPFTVFAPTNEAFAKLPPGTVQHLLQPQNRAMLTKILSYHVVSGRYSTAQLMRMIRAGGGRTTLRSVEGAPLTLTEAAGRVMVTDAKGDVARVTIPDVYQSNGVIDVVNRVLMPA